MNWRSIAFDWNQARAFLVTAEEGSFSAAARALGMTQPTLSRQVDALEAELGLVLFERTGRGLVTTPSGLQLLDHVRGMAEAASRMSLSASGHSQAIEGPICITASEVYSAFLLPPIIKKLRALHPGIQVEIIASNSPTDLLRREADIAIRNFASTQPDLIVRKLRDDNANMYATADYIEKIGNPNSFEDLKAAEFLGFANNDVMIRGLNSVGLNVVKKNFPITCDNHLVQWALAKQGVGISLMVEFVGDAEPLLRRVLPSMAPFIVPMWLVTHRELNTSARVRTVFDFLAAELAPAGR
jgi:DNA-binding transcriptional LysR family regulator